MRKLLTPLILSLFVMTFATPAFAWNDVGHKITAYIAWQRMSGNVVEGLVTDVHGAPLTGALVQLSGARFSGVTDKDGRLHIEGVPAREHLIVARAIGYVRAERTISLGRDEGARILAVLERAPSGIIYDCFGAGAGRPDTRPSE